MSVISHLLDNPDLSPDEMFYFIKGLVYAEEPFVQEFFVKLIEDFLKKNNDSHAALKTCDTHLAKGNLSDETYSRIRFLVNKSYLRGPDSTNEERFSAFRIICNYEFMQNPELIVKTPDTNDYEAMAYEIMRKRSGRDYDWVRYKVLYPDPTTKKAILAHAALTKFHSNQSLTPEEKEVLPIDQGERRVIVYKLRYEHQQKDSGFKDFLKSIEFFPESKKALLFIIGYAKTHPEFVSELRNTYKNYHGADWNLDLLDHIESCSK